MDKLAIYMWRTYAFTFIWFIWLPSCKATLDIFQLYRIRKAKEKQNNKIKGNVIGKASHRTVYSKIFYSRQFHLAWWLMSGEAPSILDFTVQSADRIGAMWTFEGRDDIPWAAAVIEKVCSLGSARGEEGTCMPSCWILLEQAETIGDRWSYK